MKAENTKRNIKRTFLELTQKTPVNKISITNLVVHANVSRGTFYTHYENIRSMLEDIAQDLLSGLDAIWQIPITHHSILHVLPSSREQLLQYLQENQHTFMLLLSKHGDPSFLNCWTEQFRNALLGRLRAEGIMPNTEIERIVAFLSFHGIRAIADSFFTEDFLAATSEVLSISDSILHFVSVGHQQLTHMDSLREHPVSPYLY